MRVYLRNVETSLFYAGANRWASEPSLALGFGAIGEAVRAAEVQDLAHMEIVLRYDEPAREMALPIRQESNRDGDKRPS